MGLRGPRPAPASMHLLRGNPSKKSLDELFDEFRPEVEIPDPPAHLLPAAAEEWARLAPELRRYGLISKLDRAALAVYCQAYARWKHAEEKLRELGDAGLVETTLTGYRQIGPWLQISNRAVETMQKFLGEFGMSPSARTRVTPSDPRRALPGVDKPSPWDQFKC